MNITRKEALEYLDDVDVRLDLCQVMTQYITTADRGCSGLLCRDCVLNNHTIYIDFITKLVEKHFE